MARLTRRTTKICLVRRCSLRFCRKVLFLEEERLNLTSSLCLSSCFTSQCIPIVHCGFECCAVPRVVLVYCGAHLKFPKVPRQLPWFTLLLLSHTDKFFTPHQRRLLPAEQHLSALSSLLSIFPSLSVFAFLSSSCVHLPIKVNRLPSLVQNPRNFLRCVKNKHPSFYVSCISLLCPFFLFLISIYFQVALIKPESLDFKLCFYFCFFILKNTLFELHQDFLSVVS